MERRCFGPRVVGPATRPRDPAHGTRGPDLTHTGARTTVAAGMRANDRRGFRDWLLATGHGATTDRDLDALAAYLDLLE